MNDMISVSENFVEVVKTQVDGRFIHETHDIVAVKF